MQASLRNSRVLLTALLVSVVAGSAFAADGSTEFDWYGYIKLDGAYDQNLTSHGNFVMWVQPTAESDDEQFNMTANETRFGLKVKHHTDSPVKVFGNIEFDLFAGVGGGTVAENKAMLQLRHAYFAMEKGSYGILAGQTWDLVGPLNPSTLNYPVLWGAGNTGYRRPQIRLWNTFGQGATSARLSAGVFRTIGSDLTPTFSLATGETSEGSDDGTDAGMPSVQALIDINHQLSSGAKARFGVSGMWGRLKAETNLGNSEKYESWATVGHLMLTLPNGFGFSSEVYTGSNYGSYFGGILNSNRVDGLKSKGGWASLWLQASPQVKLTTGLGLDDANDEDIADGERSKNQVIFGNVRYNVVGPATVGLEVANWSTEYKNGETADNLRVQTSFVFGF